MNQIVLKVLFSVMRKTPYKLLHNLSKMFGIVLSERNYNMLRNMSFADFQRSMSLVNHGGKAMPLVELHRTVNLDRSDVKDARCLKDLINDNLRYIGISADLLPQELNDSAVVEAILKNFNSFTFSNSMKWSNQLVDENVDYRNYRFEDVDQIIDVLHKNNVRLRGHNLLWGKFPGMTFPSSVKKAVLESTNPSDKLKEIIDQRLMDVLTHYKGKVQQWDVINETISYSTEFKFDGFFYDIMGEEYIFYALRRAKEIDPEIQLYLNETIGDYGGEKGKQYLAWVKKLKDSNVPLDGIGIQGHVSRGKWDVAGLDYFATELEKLGLFFEITELDISLAPYRQNQDPLGSQAQMCYDIMNVALSHRNCTGITFWGFSDRCNWYDNIQPYSNFAPNKPNLFDESLERKPMYDAAKAALLEHLESV